jgi:hypothetical protein
MQKLLILLIASTLTGCATGCRDHCVFGFGPGNSQFDTIANYHDNTDPCQHKGKIEGYQLPDYCFKGQHKRVQYVYDKQGKIVYIVK